MKSLHLPLVTLALLSLPGVSAQAQTAASPTPSAALQPAAAPASAAPGAKQPFFLTLTEALQIAETNNHDIKLAQERIEDARLQITETGAQGLPQLTATASYGRQDPILSRQSTDTSGGGGLGLGSNPQFAALLGTASVNTFQSGITLSQTLFAGFRIIDGIKLANINLELQDQALRMTRQNVAYQVTNAYFGALRAWETLQVDQESLEQVREQVRQAEVRLKAGTGVKLDVLQAQSQILQLQQRISQNLNAFEKAKMTLNQIMGRETDRPIQLNLLATVVSDDRDGAQLMQTALENRPDLRQLQLQKDISELNATIQSRAVWPTLAAQARYSLQDNAVVNGNSQNIQNMNYSVNMNWPIFDGFAAQAKSQRAQQSALQSQITLDQLQQQVSLDLEQAVMDITEARERELMARAGVELAQENVRVAQISYREGTGLMLDVLNAQLNLQQARNSLINARFDLHTRQARLYQVLGLDITGYLR
ncbi:MAG: TolC family protein [Candidatus Sericytochromatia bacterium]